MTNSDPAVAYRILIRSTVGSPGSGDDLANLDSGPLPDGAVCYVLSTRQVFRFRKFSTHATVAGIIIAPIAGGGRWVLESGPSGAYPLFAGATNTNTVDSSSSGDWLPSNSSAYGQFLGGGIWTFTALGCEAQYAGPPAIYLARVVATVTFEGPNTVYVGVNQNSDLAGTAAGFAEGAEFFDYTVSEESISAIVTAERIVSMNPTDIIQPRFRFSGGSDLDIERLTLSAVPLAAPP